MSAPALAGPPAAEARARPWEGRPGVYLYPGDLYASAKPCAISTILGTCVSVCLWDAAAGVGGMNHYLLPYLAGGDRASSRFGNVAIDRLLQEVVACGAQPRRLMAKVFGGLCSGATFPRDIGTRNVELAVARLAEARIPIVARDVGGSRGRKVVFQADDGEAWVKQL